MNIAYTRVLVMDADGIPVANLDHLFLLPLPENVHVAAPQGYWFPKASGNVTDRQGGCHFYDKYGLVLLKVYRNNTGSAIGAKNSRQEAPCRFRKA